MKLTILEDMVGDRILEIRYISTSIFILISLFLFLCYISIFVLDLLCVLCILL